MTLGDRVALVTGTRRIGAAVARRFAEAGADVALAFNRSREEAEAAAEGIRAIGRRALLVQADVSKPEDCTRLVDTTARVLAQAMQQRLNWQFVVENRPGGNGFIATTAAAKSAPDGYALLMAHTGEFAVNPALFDNVPYDL